MGKHRFAGIGILTGILVVVLIGVLTFNQGWLMPLMAQTRIPAPNTVKVSQTTDVPAALPRTITVVGEGSVTIKPDQARTNIGVETFGSSVKAATTDAAKTMDAVMAALKAQGIAEKDIQTSGYSVWVDRQPGPDGRPSETLSYRVNNNVTVTVRDLTKVGAVLDAAIEAGANSIYGVNFSIAEPRALEAQAREKAIADAQAKAAELAKLNGVAVGQVVSVSEVVASGGGFYDSNFRAMESAAKMGLGGGAGPVSPGELELALRLQVVYAIQ